MRRRKRKTTKTRRQSRRPAKKATKKAKKRATAVTKKRAKPRPRRKAPAKAKARPRPRAAKPKRRPTTARAVARSRPVARAMAPSAPAAAPPADDLARKIEDALRDRGYDPPDTTVVAVLTAIGTGYRQGPASPPSWLRVDVDGPIASGMVDRFATGDRAHDIDRSTHRPQVRATVGFNLDQLSATPVGDAERDVLTSFCLGSWDPAIDQNAERNGVASFVVPWYLAGRA
jgi:hypothetical protein